MITVKDILPWREYDKIRMERYRELARLKSQRRIDLGKRLTLLFENRITVIHQIQEMVYLDKLESKEDIEREIRIYSTMLPCGGKVKATLFINVWNDQDLREVFKSLKGIYASVFLKVGNRLIQGVPEAGRDQGDEFATVQYLTFDVGEISGDMRVMVLHENYRFEAEVPRALAEDIAKEASQQC